MSQRRPVPRSSAETRDCLHPPPASDAFRGSIRAPKEGRRRAQACLPAPWAPCQEESTRGRWRAAQHRGRGTADEDVHSASQDPSSGSPGSGPSSEPTPDLLQRETLCCTFARSTASLAVRVALLTGSHAPSMQARIL